MTAQEQAANVNRLANIPSATDCARGDEHARRPQKAPWQKAGAGILLRLLLAMLAFRLRVLHFGFAIAAHGGSMSSSPLR